MVCFFISIDSNEEKNLTHICDEVFGAENFISKMVWKNKYGAGRGTNGIANIHEYILMYGKSQLLLIETDLSEELQETYKGNDQKETKGMIVKSMFRRKVIR